MSWRNNIIPSEYCGCHSLRFIKDIIFDFMFELFLRRIIIAKKFLGHCCLKIMSLFKFPTNYRKYPNLVRTLIYCAPKFK